MTILTYALTGALGLALGWFGYDFTKASWMAVRESRRYACSHRSSRLLMPVIASVPEPGRLAAFRGVQPHRQ
jgi:hypothetical protein